MIPLVFSHVSLRAKLILSGKLVVLVSGMPVVFPCCEGSATITEET